MSKDPLDDLELVWKLSNGKPHYSINAYRIMYEHGEAYFSNLYEKEIEQSHGEYDPQSHVFIHLHRKSSLMLLYGFLENYLFNLCDLCSIHFKQDITVLNMPNPRRDKGIKKCRKYLTKILGISFDNLEKEWHSLTGLADVRSSYLHRASPELLDKRTKAIKKHYDGKESLPSEYLKISIGNVGNFIEKLESELVDKDISNRKPVT